METSAITAWTLIQEIPIQQVSAACIVPSARFRSAPKHCSARVGGEGFRIQALNKSSLAYIKYTRRRVPSLKRCVKYAESRVTELLRDWILSGAHGNTLRDVDVSVLLTEMRQRLADRIRETLDRLSDAGVVWGNWKVSNVIMDKSDSAWLIDVSGA